MPRTKPAKPKAKPAAKSKAKPAAKPKAKPAATRFRVPGPDRAVVAALDELLGGYAELRKGAMFGCPGYFVGTKAVACVFGSELNLTVPVARVDELVEKTGYRRFEPGGRTMSGWVLIDQERLSALEPDDGLLAEAIAYARSKATKPAKPAKLAKSPKR